MPPPMTPAEARVADQVLTTVARGYRNPAHAWPFLFPVVPVGARGGKIITFGAEDFQEVDLTRAPGERRKEQEYGYEGSDYALVQRALDGKVPVEVAQDAAAVPGIDQRRVAVSRTMAIVSLQIEIEAARIATTQATYTNMHRAALVGNLRWDNAASTPAKRVEQAKEDVAEGIGMEPNVLVMGPPVFRALCNNPDVIDRVKHTEGLKGPGQPTINEAKLAAYFGLDRVVVARARKGVPGAFTPIWGKNAVLAYSNVTPLAAMGSPSYGYCYRLRGYPVANPGYYDAKVDSWIYPVTTEDTPVITGIDAAYLFQTVVD